MQYKITSKMLIVLGVQWLATNLKKCFIQLTRKNSLLQQSYKACIA